MALSDEPLHQIPQYNLTLFPHLRHSHGSGGFYNMESEIRNARSGPCYAELLYPKHLDYIYDCFVYQQKREGVPRFEPLSYATVLMEKAPKTSVGLPLQVMYASMGDYFPTPNGDEEIEDSLINEELCAIILQELHEIEAGILKGQYPPVVWRGFPKRDKYTAAKIESGRYRIVSCAPLYFFAIMKRYFGPLVEFLETRIRQFHLITTEDLTYAKVVSRLCDLYSLGIDYSSYDKNSVSTLLIKSIEVLYRLSNGSIPEHIYDFVTSALAHPTTALFHELEDGSATLELYDLCGSNPSGQFLTSWCNTMTHLIHTTFYLLIEHNIQPLDYWTDHSPLISVETGDDGIEASHDEQFLQIVANTLPDFINNYFAIPAEVDLLTGLDGTKKLYQPELLAPYLNTLWITRKDGTYYPLYSDPTRLVPKAMYLTTNEIHGSIDSTFHDRFRGICDELKTHLLHSALNPTLPRNSTVAEIFSLSTKYGLSVPTTESLYQLVCGATI